MTMKFSGEHDDRDAIVAIHPGAGGTESQDWAEMLLRMYLRFCERRGWSTETVDYQAGEEAGIKSATMMVRADYAYGYLKSEHGVHRLVRISPFDAAKRRHTSFASVYIYPDIRRHIETASTDKDLRTGYEVGDVQRVLDGDLDGFIEAYLAQRARTAAE